MPTCSELASNNNVPKTRSKLKLSFEFWPGAPLVLLFRIRDQNLCFFFGQSNVSKTGLKIGVRS